MVGTPAGQQLDDAAIQRISDVVGSTVWAELILVAVSAGSMLLANGLVVTATAVLRGPWPAVVGGVAGAMVVVVTELLELVLDRPAFLAGTAGNSFPSGHVAAVAGRGLAVVVRYLARAGGLWPSWWRDRLPV